MADNTHDPQTHQGHPPAHGRQDHAAMRAASMQPVEVPGAASTDTLAASGGLNVPGNDRAGSMGIVVPTESPVHEPIPGERDPTNLMPPQPGVMGSLVNDNLPAEPSTLDDATRHEREMEGGLDKG